MASRLRRMYLIDVRTSADTSGTINEIDPRGGVAVTGANAAGKSTTLQLIPLFFGNVPSEISLSGGGRLPMLQHVLPNPTSAIVFEYQRGPTDDDINCVVLRRGERTNAAAYRFFTGPYQREFFATLRADGQEVLSDDVAFAALAPRSGAQITQIYTTAQYRSIILNALSITQNDRKLRNESLRFSYGNRSLANLDRLSTAVVKEAVNFKDFIGVAVSIIQTSMGKQSKAGTPVSIRIALDQGTSQIVRGLNNVDACKQVDRMEPTRLALEQCLARTAPISRTRSQLAANLEKLRADRSAQLKQHGVEAELIVEERYGALMAEQARAVELAAIAKTANDARVAAQNAYQDDKDRLDHFEKDDAAGRALAVAGIPSKQSEKDNLSQQIQLAQGEAASLANQCSQFIHDAFVACDADKTALQAQINQRNDAARIELEADRESEKLAIEAARTDAVEPMAENKQQQDDLLGNVAVARARAASSTVSSAITEAYETASRAYLDAVQKLGVVKSLQQGVEAELRTSSDQFTAAERKLDDAQRLELRAVQQVKSAETQLVPAAGSVLEALRASDNTAWLNNLARIIRPELLASTNLEPEFLGGSIIPGGAALPDDTAYGWSLATDKIDPPEWIDEAGLRARLENLYQQVKVAGTKVAECRRAVDAASAARSILAQKLALAQADTSMAAQKEQTSKMTSDQATSNRAEALKAAAQSAQTKLMELLTQQQKLKTAGEKLAQAFKTALGTISNQATARREKAAERHREEIKKLNELLTACTTRFENQKAALIAHRDQAMTAAGVSMNTLNAVQTKIDIIELELTKLQVAVPFVNSWNAWLAAGGHTWLDALHAALDKARSVDKAAIASVEVHGVAARAEAVAHDKRVANLKSGLDKAASELEKLSEVAAVLGIESSALAPEEDLSVEAADLLLAARKYAAEEAGNMDAMRQHVADLKKALTSSASNVSDVITNGLAAHHTNEFTAQAELLKTVIVQAQKSVQADNRTAYGTMMTSISLFVKDVKAFDAAVKDFNEKLRVGMRQVSKFNSVQNFDVQVTTNLDALSFWADLKSLQIDERAGRSLTHPELPIDDDAVAAVRKVQSMLEKNGKLEFDMHEHIFLKGSALINGQVKSFHRESDLAAMSSNGLNLIIIVTLLSGMFNTLRGDDPIYVPWVTDEIGRLDGPNFIGMIQMLKDNRIDVITASPLLNIAQLRHFSRRYYVEANGTVARYIPETKAPRRLRLVAPAAASDAALEH